MSLLYPNLKLKSYETAFTFVLFAPEIHIMMLEKHLFFKNEQGLSANLQLILYKICIYSLKEYLIQL